MAGDAVFDFMKAQNRPFSINDIQQNVSKDFGKSAIQKALDKLVDKGKLFEKTYGKQKVYCLVQDAEASAGGMDEELRQINREITEVTTNMQSVTNKLQTNMAKLSSLKGKVSVEEAERNKKQLEQEICITKKKLEGFGENFKLVSEEEKKRINIQYEKYEKEYKKRKRMCKEIIGQIMENYPKREKQLLEEVGIETDEDVNFKLEI